MLPFPVAASSLLLACPGFALPLASPSLAAKAARDRPAVMGDFAQKLKPGASLASLVASEGVAESLIATELGFVASSAFCVV